MVWIWILAVVLRVLFFFEINLLCGKLLTPIPDVTLFLLGMGVLLHYTVRYVKESTPKPTVPVSLVLLSALILWATPLPVVIGAHSRLLRKQTAFEKLIGRIESEPPARAALLPHVDPGPPLRVAFDCGLLDGKPAAIIHAPPNPEYPPATWFNGRVSTHRHLRGYWHLCTFQPAPSKKRLRPAP